MRTRWLERVSLIFVEFIGGLVQGYGVEESESLGLESLWMFSPPSAIGGEGVLLPMTNSSTRRRWKRCSKGVER